MRLLLSLALGLLTAALGSAAFAGAAPWRVHDKALGDVLISCRAGRPPAAVKAETQSGVPLNSRYAVEHEADKGLVRLMNEAGRRVRAYAIPARSIRALVEVRMDQTLPDYAVLAFEARKLVLIHTSTANAGIFTGGAVFELPLDRQGRLAETALMGDAEANAFLKLGLAAYSRSAGRCASEGA